MNMAEHFCHIFLLLNNNGNYSNIVYILLEGRKTMANYTTQTSDKSKTVALILCIFLGVLGIHRFYVGKIGTGILYLFTGGLFCFGWFIDIFKIATGTFTDNVGVPLRK